MCKQWITRRCMAIYLFKVCNFTGALSLTSVFLGIWLHFCQPVFCRTSHNLVCNKFAILKNKKCNKIIGKS